MAKPELWKTKLEPFAMVMAGIAENIRNMENDELLELYDACKEPTSTNCWCWTYEAAKFVRKEADIEIRQRKLLIEAKP